MQKIVYSTSDILEEFFTRASMKLLDKDSIDRIVPTIFDDSFQLLRVVRVIHGVRTVYYMVEWKENGELCQDEWNRPWENFIGAIAHNYICEAMKY